MVKPALLLIAALATCTLHAQEPFATLSTSDARVAGLMEVSGRNVRLLTNANITAFDHTAPITLVRGGNVNLCTNSNFQLLRSSSGEGLQFALNRGAMEVSSPAHPQDALLTPDLRFTLLTGGTLDVRMRVARNGDVCIENRGDKAPVLQVTETFSDGVYHLAPGQHVLFEHGSTRAVVDKERTDCGCPPMTPQMLADAQKNSVAAQHPFPEADSAGLGGASPNLAISPDATASISNIAPAPAAQPGDPTATTSFAEGPPPPPPADDLVHIIARFFRKLFHRKPKTPPAPPPAPPAAAPPLALPAGPAA